VLLAELLAEDRRAPTGLWQEPLIASRLVEYEVWSRLHVRGLWRKPWRAAETLLARISMVELLPLVLRRALEPFPEPVRTLDALHLAAIDFLRQRRLNVRLATYDKRMTIAATAIGVPLVDLS
jgi:hypothetical protein